MSRRFYAEVPLRDLAQIRKALVMYAESTSSGHCGSCYVWRGRLGATWKGSDPDPHEEGCKAKAALDILDAYIAYVRHLAPRALKPKLVKSLR